MTEGLYGRQGEALMRAGSRALVFLALTLGETHAEWRMVHEVNEMDGVTTTSFVLEGIAPTRPLVSHEGEVLSTMEVQRSGRKGKCDRIQLAFEFNVVPELRVNKDGNVSSRLKWDDDKPIRVPFSTTRPAPPWVRFLWGTAGGPKSPSPDSYGQKLWQNYPGIIRETRGHGKGQAGLQVPVVGTPVAG